MDKSKLSSLTSAVATDSSIITDFLKADSAQRTQLLTKLSSDKSLNLTTSDISEIISNPEELMSGMELSDEALALAAGGGKGDATSTVGGGVNNSNYHVGGGNTSSSGSANVSQG